MHIPKLPIRMIAISLVWTIASYATDGQEFRQGALSERQYEKMLFHLRSDGRFYGDVDEWAPDPRDAGTYIDGLVRPNWAHGMPRQMLDVITVAPAHFAPVIRDRLLRLPPTLEEYVADYERAEHLYSTSASQHARPMGPESGRLCVVTTYLGREHAEPILRAFADGLIALQRQAEERAAALPENDVNERSRLGVLARHFARLRMPAITASGSLGSPMFVEEGMRTLERGGDIASAMAQSGLAEYLAAFAADDPALRGRMNAVADRFESSRSSQEQIMAHYVRQQMRRTPPDR